jgi:uncharacterized protein (DUF885 family)
MSIHNVRIDKQRYRHLLTFTLALVVLCGASSGQERPLPTQALRALFDEEWNRELSEDPVWASALRNRTWNQQWPDESAEAVARRLARLKEALRKLQLIDRSQLSNLGQVNYDLFLDRNQTAIAEDQFRYHLFPFNPGEHNFAAVRNCYL